MKTVLRFDSTCRFLMKLGFSDDDFAMIGRKVTIKDSGSVALIIDAPHYNWHYGHTYVKWGVWKLEDKTAGIHSCLMLDRNQFELYGE